MIDMPKNFSWESRGRLLPDDLHILTLTNLASPILIMGRIQGGNWNTMLISFLPNGA